MILKNADDKSQQLSQLEEMLKTADPGLRQRIEYEIRTLRAGIKGEKESAYHINFYLKKSKSTVVIHDLRLELDGRVAQIDHLIIQGFHRFYVLETKHFAHGLKINEYGEFLRWDDWRKTYEGIASPVEQNNRHVAVLKDALSQIGMKRPAAIVPFVLVSSNARIDRHASSVVPEVVKADQFFRAYEADLDASIEKAGLGNIGTLARFAFGASPEEIGRKLLSMHRPMITDYRNRLNAPNKTDFRRRASDQVGLSSPVTREAGTGKGCPETLLKCKACSSADLQVEYGKFGYYFKCTKCGANTAIKIGCGVDGHKERIRKHGAEFFRECAQCSTSAIFFRNAK